MEFIHSYVACLLEFLSGVGLYISTANERLRGEGYHVPEIHVGDRERSRDLPGRGKRSRAGRHPEAELGPLAATTLTAISRAIATSGREHLSRCWHGISRRNITSAGVA